MRLRAWIYRIVLLASLLLAAGAGEKWGHWRFHPETLRRAARPRPCSGRTCCTT